MSEFEFPRIQLIYTVNINVDIKFNPHALKAKIFERQLI
jgi:hypothetical protein